MDAPFLLRAAAAASVCALGVLANAAHAGTADCDAAAAATPVLADRRATIAALQQMPDACLKRIVLECQRAMDRRVLDFGSAATCSMGYEALLSKSFGGNFQALLAWWRTERGASAVQ